MNFRCSIIKLALCFYFLVRLLYRSINNLISYDKRSLERLSPAYHGHIIIFNHDQPIFLYSHIFQKEVFLRIGTNLKTRFNSFR